MEPNSKCNLRCPGCATGIDHPNRRTGGLAQVETIRKVLNEVHPYTLQVGFYRYGESLLSDAFYEGCRYAVELGLWTTAHSNLSVKLPDIAERRIDSRLNHLTVSCDGATQEAYEKYRRGGDIELVLGNIHRIIDARKKAKRYFPWVSAEMLLFDHNWHEIESFRRPSDGRGSR